MLDSTSVRRNVPVIDAHEEPGYNIREWLSLRALYSCFLVSSGFSGSYLETNIVSVV